MIMTSPEIDGVELETRPLALGGEGAKSLCIGSNSSLREVA